MLSIIMWFIATLVLVFGPIILIHELGHFIAARRSGIRVEEFGFGLPPRILVLGGETGRMQIDDVECTIPGRTWVPYGLERGGPVEALARKEAGGSYRISKIKVPSDQKDVTPGIVEQKDGVLISGMVTQLDLGTQYTLNLLPFGAFVRMTGEEDPSDPRSLAAQSKLKRLAALLGGSVANLIAAILILTAAYMIGSPEAFYTHIDVVEPNSAAAEAGFQIGDIITAVDGVPLVDGSPQVRDSVLDSPQEPITMSVIRDGETLTLVATPRLTNGRGYLGIGMTEWPNPNGLTHYSFPEALTNAGQDLAEVVSMVFRLPSMIREGSVTAAQARPASAVGINALLTFTLQTSIEWGIAFPTLHTAAVVSLALGLTNLLPLPALDGGRAVFVLIEALRGRRLNPDIEARIHAVALMILLTLMVYIMVQDIINPVIDWSLLER